jgi:DNA-binding NarL/FixJ family response regulator
MPVCLLPGDDTNRGLRWAGHQSTDIQQQPTEVVRYACRRALTERETQVLTLIAEGLTNHEIAQRLVVSPLTAKTHVSRVMLRLGARDRVQLVVQAYESGLVRPGRMIAD